jgi:hypothetical protein
MKKTMPDLTGCIMRRDNKGSPEQVHVRHSGARRNPVKSSIWTPAFAGVTAYSVFSNLKLCYLNLES